VLVPLAVALHLELGFRVIPCQDSEAGLSHGQQVPPVFPGQDIQIPGHYLGVGSCLVAQRDSAVGVEQPVALVELEGVAVALGDMADSCVAIMSHERSGFVDQLPCFMVVAGHDCFPGIEEGDAKPIGVHELSVLDNDPADLGLAFRLMNNYTHS